MMQGSVRIPTHLLGVLCEYFEVTERTVRRWQKEGAPAYVLRFIELHEGLRESWNGVCVRDGFLVLPDGSQITSHQVTMFYYWQAQALAETKRCEVLERKLRQVSQVMTSANEPTSLAILAELKGS